MTQIPLCIGAAICVVGWWVFDDRYDDHTTCNWIELDPDGRSERDAF
jgi:hypothetical protein